MRMPSAQWKQVEPASTVDLLTVVIALRQCLDLIAADQAPSTLRAEACP
jgi:hypothetical protein